jgi:hypothetical protein
MPAYEWQLPLTLEKLHKVLSEHPAFNNPLVAIADATITLNAEKHDGRTLLLDRAAGVTVTLPASTGRGAKYLVKVKTLATSNSHIVKVTTTDIIQGTVSVVDTDTAGTVTGFATAADSDTVTLNRSTTGSVTIGEWLEFEDTAKGVWTIRGVLSNTGSGATPFSAGVS